ncbi:MAG: hypothetical protein IJ060_07645 [Oscillospiraceae bacterium]|nr:hypothetical protein [Oscillospiraceae bacterium]
MKQYEYQEEKPQIIDVPSYEPVSDAELFGEPEPAQPEMTEAEFEALSRAVMADPARCFCRNCGKPVLKAASVCVNCRYVINPAALRQGAQRLREKRAKYEKSHRFFRFVNDLTGVDLESPERKSLFEISPQRYAFRTTGAVYCTNCGRQVEEGASVCVHCQYVLNPVAVQRAQMALADKKARLTPGLFFRSLLIPGFGRKQRIKWAVRRPQIAKPCGILGKINFGLLAAAAAVLVYWLV